jgi:hypothetical protein
VNQLLISILRYFVAWRNNHRQQGLRGATTGLSVQKTLASQPPIVVILDLWAGI